MSAAVSEKCTPFFFFSLGRAPLLFRLSSSSITPNYYQPGDRVFLFGFIRGAHTVAVSPTF
jgi:hypothetical protein